MFTLNLNLKWSLLNGYASAAGPSIHSWRSGSLESWRPGSLEAWGPFFDRNLDMWSVSLEDWRPGGLEAWRSGGLGAIFGPKFGQNIVFFNVFEQNVLKTVGFQGFWKICAQNHWFFNDSEGPTGAGPKEFAHMGEGELLTKLGPPSLARSSKKIFDPWTWSLGAWKLGDLETWSLSP